jgi:hypothetical protein
MIDTFQMSGSSSLFEMELMGSSITYDRLYGLVVRVLGYRSGDLPALPEKKRVVGLERGLFSLVNTTEELLDRKVAAPV